MTVPSVSSIKALGPVGPGNPFFRFVHGFAPLGLTNFCPGADVRWKGPSGWRAFAVAADENAAAAMTARAETPMRRKSFDFILTPLGLAGPCRTGRQAAPRMARGRHRGWT